MKSTPLCLPLLAWALSPTCALADELFVLPGESLALAVASTSDGDTVTILSDETFPGPISLSMRNITLQAGHGFQPAIEGGAFQSAITCITTPGGSTKSAIRGLRLIPGPASVPVPALLLVEGTTPGATPFAALSVEDYVLEGGLELVGLLDDLVAITVSSTVIDGPVEARGSLASAIDIDLESGSKVGELALSHSGTGRISARVEDVSVGGGVELIAGGSSDLQGFLRRVDVGGPADLEADPGAAAYALFESCLLRGPGSGTGIDASGTAWTRAVNCTVTGFGLGLAAQSPSSFSNLALFDNGIDLANPMQLQQIDHSLIEDGTFAGQNGNFGGTPLVGSDLALLPGSIGIDAGDSGASSLGSFDLAGAARVQDGGIDGVAVVDVGAFELADSCPPASHELFNGSGINPFLLGVAEEPVLGGVFVVKIDPEPDTLSTLLAIGFEAPTPLVVPGIGGEVLLNLSTNVLLFGAQGLHSVGIAPNPAACGLELAAQGLRVDPTATGVDITATNGARLVLGHP